LGLLSSPYPLFQWYPHSKEFFKNLSRKLSISYISRFESIFILVVQVGAVKMYVAAVEALKEKERRDKTQFFSTKIAGKTTLGCSYIVL
jgi:hypothetical protein